MSKETKKKVTEAQKRATAKYNAKSYERIELRVTRGKKEIISKAAQHNNESVNSLINRAIDSELERMKDKDYDMVDYITDMLTSDKP